MIKLIQKHCLEFATLFMFLYVIGDVHRYHYSTQIVPTYKIEIKQKFYAYINNMSRYVMASGQELCQARCVIVFVWLLLGWEFSTSKHFKCYAMWKCTVQFNLIIVIISPLDNSCRNLCLVGFYQSEISNI